MSTRDTPGNARVTSEPFGTLADGRAVTAFTMTNSRMVEVRLLDYGCIVQSIWVPCHDYTVENVTLGYQTLGEYERDTAYHGAMCGRYANRIARGRFSLDGREFTLATNNGPNHLHGGVTGFNRAVWHAEMFEESGGAGVELRHVSRDGDEGYPGTLEVTVRVMLSGDNALSFECSAVTDQPTPVNLAQHSYFNLSGGRSKDILAHELTVHAKEFTPVDATMIPTGARSAVRGTPFDFSRPTAVGARIGAPDEQLQRGSGYDHNFVLDKGMRGTITLAASLRDPESGRMMQVLTTQPGLQFYSGNFLSGAHPRRGGLALEAQHFPDSPNKPDFPSTILRPGEEYRQTTVYRFDWA